MKIWVSTVHDSCHFSYIFVGELRSVPTVALTSGLLLHTATLNALQFNSILINGFCHFPQVDCTVNSETCGRFGVNGYPTLKIFRNGEDFAAYDGPRSAGGYFKIIAVLVCVLCVLEYDSSNVVQCSHRWHCEIHEKTGRSQFHSSAQ